MVGESQDSPIFFIGFPQKSGHNNWVAISKISPKIGELLRIYSITAKRPILVFIRPLGHIQPVYKAGTIAANHHLGALTLKNYKGWVIINTSI